jgi:hypothetical protein
MLLPVAGIEGGKRKRMVVRAMYANEIWEVSISNGPKKNV